jgi:hypothetical protein
MAHKFSEVLRDAEDCCFEGSDPLLTAAQNSDSGGRLSDDEVLNKILRSLQSFIEEVSVDESSQDSKTGT